ncbi:MAG TPA: hypothetical protein VFL54_08215, partial [Gammaproteobacteria bacterium]|nr:hypothetical protein [Gammaproteobacteria bacterium]
MADRFSAGDFMKSYCAPRPPVAKPNSVAIAVGLALAGSLPVAHAASPMPDPALGGAFLVNTGTVGRQDSSAMAMDAAGDFVVVWEDDGGRDGDGSGIFMQRYRADGTLLGHEVLVNTQTSGHQFLPAVAMDASGDFVVAWTDGSGADGDNNGVFMRRYRADGVPLGNDVLVNQAQTAGAQGVPAVAMDAAGDFVVAWKAAGIADNDVFMRRYRADGAPLGGPMLVNTTHTAGPQILPKIAMDAAGDFVIVWADVSGADGDGAGVFAQRYSADGTPLEGEVLVNAAQTAGGQARPVVGMDAGGDFVVAWTDISGADGDSYGIFMQRYRADGTPLGGEVLVNKSQTIGNQQIPAIAMDAVGDFAIAWEDTSGADGDGYGVFMQRYTADGAPLGDEIQVNTTQTAGNQAQPAAAMDAAGDFAVAWADYSGADGSGYGVFAQRYMREISLDLKATLAVAPADVVKPGGGLILTGSISNTEPESTLTGNATIDAELNVTRGLTATLKFPGNVGFNYATGTNWTCPAMPANDGTLVCTYDTSLNPASETTPL